MRHPLFVGAASIFALQACAGWRSGWGPTPARTASVTVMIGGSPAVSGRRLQPGRPVDISISIRDREGYTFSTEDGDIMSGAYTITATPGSLRTNAGPMYLQFTPSSDRSVEEYTIEVSLRGRPGQPMRYVYGADWAAARGPEPTDVAALEFSLVDEQCDGDGTCTLAPDRRVGLLTRVRTRDGTVHGSEGVPSVPHDRLRVEAHGFDWDPATHQFTVRTDVPSQDESPYRVAVSYVGRDDLRVERRYHVDFAQLRGPEPASIRTLRASLVDRQAIAPDEQARLNVEAVDDHGRVFRLGVERPLIPASRIRFVGRNLTFDPRTRVVTARPGESWRPEQGFDAEVSYEGRADLTARIHVPMDYLHALRQWLSGSWGRIEFAGSAGARGGPGTPGVPGRNGSSGGPRFGGDAPRVGHDARSGGAGGQGGTGGEGGPGPRVRVVVNHAWTLGGGHLALVIVESAGRTIFRVVPDDTPPLTIVNAGGRGGEGGPGGEGGAGGIGATAFHAGSGGPGGAGGRGGTGGQGGPGGTYEIIAADSSLLTRVVCGGSGGEGGPGGQGGRPGRGGGAGALAGEAQTLNGQNVVVHGYAAAGGSAGTPGPAGTVGREGQGGSIDPRVSPAEVQSAMHSLPPELRAAIVLDRPRTSPASRRP